VISWKQYSKPENFRIFLLPSGQIPTLPDRERLEVVREVRDLSVQSTASMFHRFPAGSCRLRSLKLLSCEIIKKIKFGNNSPFGTSDEKQCSFISTNGLLENFQKQAGQAVQDTTNLVSSPLQWLLHIRTYW
jgi:hypothetical protein